MTANLPAHSPLGGSGASRWMPCPGSVAQSHGVEDDESEYAALGTAAHTLGEDCLTTGENPWEYIGGSIWGGNVYPTLETIDLPEGAIPIDKDMADAVQIYLDAVRMWHPDRNQGNFFVEKKFYSPSIHKFFYGQSDVVYIDDDERTLHVWDYKHGAGIIIEVPWNSQGMYYACGIMEELDLWGTTDKVVIHIAQPRGWHSAGPIRHWSIVTDDLMDWLEGALIPSMDHAMVSHDTVSGEHCRFCPARSRACPRLVENMKELQKMVEETQKVGADKLTNVQVATFMDLFDTAKIVNKEAEKTAFARLSAGAVVPGRKLANARANRTWKDGAEMAIKKKFGKKAMTVPVLLSPAKIEAMPEGETLTARWAEKPDAGLTVVKAGDSRRAVNTDTKSLFKAASKKRKGK